MEACVVKRGFGVAALDGEVKEVFEEGMMIWLLDGNPEEEYVG